MSGGPTIALLALLSGWVSQLTGLPPAPLPQVELTDYAIPGGSWRPTVLIRWADGVHSMATTTPGHVYLHLGWDARNIDDVCILMHELVHVAQFNAGIKYKYVEDMEAQAYDAHRKCGEAFGLKWTLSDETLKRLTTHHD